VFYVREDGGTPSECSGESDAAYPGSGTGQACALIHPAWAIGAPGTTALMSAGDTLIISPGQYMIGYGMPNTTGANCGPSWKYDCVMSPIPAGSDSSHKTKIYGKGWDTGTGTKPQLYGASNIPNILKTTGSNIEIQYLDLTDHESCISWGSNLGDIGCGSDENAKRGLFMKDGSNLYLKNVDIHGLSVGGILAFRLTDFTAEYVNIYGNGLDAGWDGDCNSVTDCSGENSSNSGTITFNHVNIEWNGCSEVYPLVSALGNQANYSHCTDQSDNGGNGDGLGTGLTGGDWVFTDVNLSHNTSDGLD
jgi:hypothetical protein